MKDRGIFIARVIQRRELCREHFEIALSMRDFPHAEPGQFVQIHCRAIGYGDKDLFSEGGTLLRRPFSIAGLRREGGEVRLVIMGRVVGPGTAWLNSLAIGQGVDLLGPLGRPFTRPVVSERALLIAGGVGLPPIRWLGEVLARAGASCSAIFGARSRDFVPLRIIEEPRKDGEMTRCAEEFSREGISAAITTDDGSIGVRGTVVTVLDAHLRAAQRGAATRVYACGPERMLQSVARTCAAAGVACEVALERVMGCGMGTCQSCVVPVRDASRTDGWRYALCCTEGPVFETTRVIWV